MRRFASCARFGLSDSGSQFLVQSKMSRSGAALMQKACEDPNRRRPRLSAVHLDSPARDSDDTERHEPPRQNARGPKIR